MKDTRFDIPNIIDNSSSKSPVMIQTSDDVTNGQDKCPKCGATDISLNVSSGKLRCNFCRYEFVSQSVMGLESDISKLDGVFITTGASSILDSSSDMVTLKCSSCGSEVVIDTASSMQARCHWCRNTLSINEQIPNGSVPDFVLPFSITKEEAQRVIEGFVSRRKFFAHPKFVEEFTTDNIMGVYFPYMLVDLNTHAKLIGQGEKMVRRYTRGIGDSEEVYYDAEQYYVERSFDMAITDLSIESNSDRINNKSVQKTNNIINTIMPFDTENCVRYNANYLKGYTSERRDLNVEQLKNIVDMQTKDIIRFRANETLKEYDRGVCWNKEDVLIKGQQWKAAYLPVWLYSYQEINEKKKILHYVAVNARTKEVMGSIPVHMPKLIGISLGVEIFGILLALFIDSKYNFLFLFLGVFYFLFIFLRYRNIYARHHYEVETKSCLSSLEKVDTFVTKKTGLSNPRIEGENSTSVHEVGILDKMLSSISEENIVSRVVDDKK